MPPSSPNPSDSNPQSQAGRDPLARRAQKSKSPTFRPLPLVMVVLNNDNENDALFVVRALADIGHMTPTAARSIMLAAHTHGSAVIATVHRELAELYLELYDQQGISISLEPVKH